ncbi:MAG: hypothetical protein M5U08_19015 [Burkholderiales bacterium]|nr:hypothetical protein [Burkholderiales bacterium]
MAFVFSRRLAALGLAAGLAVATAVAQTRSVTLAVGDLSGPGFSARSLRVELAGDDLSRARRSRSARSPRSTGPGATLQ